MSNYIKIGANWLITCGFVCFLCGLLLLGLVLSCVVFASGFWINNNKGATQFGTHHPWGSWSARPGPHCCGSCQPYNTYSRELSQSLGALSPNRVDHRLRAFSVASCGHNTRGRDTGTRRNNTTNNTETRPLLFSLDATRRIAHRCRPCRWPWFRRFARCHVHRILQIYSLTFFQF